MTARLFFFNTNTDFLPYYKNYTQEISEDKTLAELLENYQKQIGNYAINSLVSINSILVEDSLSIKDIVNRFGYELEIEPISLYRASRDLEINDTDFLEKMIPLKTYCDESDIAYYKTLTRAYYASSSLKHNQDYYGDALFLLADRLITKDATNKEAILKIISDPQNGIFSYEYEDNTLPAIEIADTINRLKDMMPRKDTSSSKANEIIAKIKAKIFTKERVELPSLRKVSDVDFSKLELVHSFKGFNIAFYKGPKAQNDHQKLLTFTQAKEVSFSAQNRASGINIVENARQTAFSKGVEIIFDAFDNSADILVVNSDEERAYLDSKKLKKSSNRAIDLQILTSSQLLEIALGNRDKKSLGLEKAHISFL